jgi:glutathione synthase
MDTEVAGYTTSHLALAALARGHEVVYIGVADFTHGADGEIRAHATIPDTRPYDDVAELFDELQGDDAKRETVDIGKLDVLVLRNDPAQDRGERTWAQYAGLLFGRAAVHQGVLVVNDPDGLSRAMNKMYLESFPDEVRPRTLITRNAAEIHAFLTSLGGSAVLKPLQGSGGDSVFLVQEKDHPNLNQMIEAISRQGYVIVQRYLEGASKKDVRLFLMNGEPLEIDGHYAAIQRVGAQDDVRTNISVGGKPERAKVTDVHLAIAAAVRPRLLEDGMFLVGLDIGDDRIMEINVFSPGGLHCASDLEGVDFCARVIEALEHKLAHQQRYVTPFENARLATL